MYRASWMYRKGDKVLMLSGNVEGSGSIGFCGDFEPDGVGRG